MKMIKLSYRDQSHLIGHLLHKLAIPRDHIEGEPEEVLTLWTTADGSILGFRTEPARKLDPRIDLLQDGCPLEHVPVHLEKLIQEIVRGRT